MTTSELLRSEEMWLLPVFPPETDESLPAFVGFPAQEIHAEVSFD